MGKGKKKLNIRKKNKNVVLVTGAIAEKTRALDYMRRYGYSPLTLGGIKGKGGVIDDTRFRLVARKQHKYQPLK